jgi:MoaA/NifB/PqqE/SkfB family radical SAM enzyme
MLRIDQYLMVEASLLATGADNHRVANLLAGYRMAADMGEGKIFAEQERELRKFVARARQRKFKCGMFCEPDCDRPDCPLRVGC